MNKKTKLEEVYEKKLNEVDEMDVTDENYGKAVEGVAKLANQVIEEKREKGDRKSRWFKDGADVAIKTATLIVTVAATIVCLRYEETGTITTTPGRKWVDKILKG
jgi:N-acetylglucosamine kinase-like BadF-type ATPase